MADHREFSSFRDPSGYLFWRDDILLRQVAKSYGAQYDHARSSGLFQSCIDQGWMVSFKEEPAEGFDGGGHVLLRPDLLDFISYPYEWCFDQLRDAALTTLDVHIEALGHDMLLKDASGYNIQFQNGRPIFIDHLSFDFAEAHGHWPAYGQFCRHFLAPLALMSYRDADLGRLLRLHLDGVPLDLASALLPLRSRLRPGLLTHIHLHARYVTRYGDTSVDAKNNTKPRRKLTAATLSILAKSLRQLITKMRRNTKATTWRDYYANTNYDDQASAHKHALVQEMTILAAPRSVWDLGGNNGAMSRSVRAAVNDAKIVCLDVDEAAVNANYLKCKAEGETGILPLVFDFTNPSPDIGFANRERRRLNKRGTPDLTIVLAFIHHMVFSHNLPLRYLAEYFASNTNQLIVEFVPMEDSQVQRLIRNKREIDFDYSEEIFLLEFQKHFNIVKERNIENSDRKIFLMKRNLV